MFFKSSETEQKMALPADELLVIAGLALLVLAIFFKADWLVELIRFVVE